MLLYHLIHSLLYLCDAILQVEHWWWLVHRNWSWWLDDCYGAQLACGLLGWLYFCWVFCFQWKFGWLFQLDYKFVNMGLFTVWETMLNAFTYFNTSLKPGRVGQFYVACPHNSRLSKISITYLSPLQFHVSLWSNLPIS